MPARSDAALVGAARGGDKEAFALLLERHRPMLLSLCSRVVRDPNLAEDAAQEAALRALVSLDRLRQPDRFGPWLASIGLNVCRQWLRYRARDAWSLDALLGGRLLDEPIHPDAGPEIEVEAFELAHRVRTAVLALPRRQRAAVAMFYLAGLTHAETATALGIEVGAVKTRLHKARATLKRTLGAIWKEELMVATESEAEFFDVRVEDVLSVPVADSPSERRVVLLATTDGERVLPIWIGQFEGDAIAVLLVDAHAPRPLTFEFASRLLQAAGGTLREVRVNRLADETFYAEVVVDGPSGTRRFDARPSDAISLALVLHAPIQVAAAVLDQAGKLRTEIEERRPGEAKSALGMAEEIRSWAARPKFSGTLPF